MTVARLGARLQTVTDLPPEDAPQWNASRIQDIPVGVGGIEPGDALVYSGSSLTPEGLNHYRVASTAGDYTVSGNLDLLLVDATAGDVDVTLPAVAPGGTRLHVKKIDASGNSVFLLGSGGALIDGDPQASTNVQYMTITVVSDGSAWWTILPW